jgi:hypothetical protein
LACILGQQRGFYPPPDYNQANTEHAVKHHYSQQQQQQYSQQQLAAYAYVPQPAFSPAFSTGFSTGPPWQTANTGPPWQTADKNRDALCLGINTHRTAEPKQPKEKRKERNALLRKVEQ